MSYLVFYSYSFYITVFWLIYFSIPYGKKREKLKEKDWIYESNLSERALK